MEGALRMKKACEHYWRIKFTDPIFKCHCQKCGKRVLIKDVLGEEPYVILDKALINKQKGEPWEL